MAETSSESAKDLRREYDSKWEWYEALYDWGQD